jgi:heme/copper-type cytochrome/quinol oxidase subunit 4
MAEATLQTAEQALEVAQNHLREGRFQRSLALLTAVTSIVSGLEVAYEHYRGSYSRRVMYTPVILSVLLAAAAFAAVFSRKAARTVLRFVAAVTLLDAAVGFYFHIRGIYRKPGGWRLPMTNMIMGPPIFAPLLFGTSAYLGLIASFLQQEEAPGPTSTSGKDSWLARLLPSGAARKLLSAEQDMREGKFQRQVAIATGISSLLSGFEAYYSHYKNNFQYKVQWTPVVISPLLAAVAFGAVKSRKLAVTALPAMSAVASVDAAVGFYYHLRAVSRRPGGRKHLVYNVIYGPPIFAPLLFGAAGMLGFLASLLRRRNA